MSSPIIKVDNVSLWRRTQEEFHYDLKRMLFALLERRYRKPSRRQVLDGVTFDVEVGEKLALIGPNGSGKSTLLKVICAILQPTVGRSEVRGRIAPLIELGAGFDTELSLVDNIVYYGILLGVSKPAMEQRVDAILDFAELADHRNEPVKALSSGMTARLSFAIATDVQPEILILDEVLSVGDERFRRKCQERIDRFWDAHSTIVVVSHDLDFVARSCDRAIWLENGKVVFDGPAPEAAQRYRESAIASGLLAERDKLLARVPENGALLVRGRAPTVEGQKVYAIRDGERRWVIDVAWIQAHGYRWPDDVVVVDDAVIQTIPEGHIIASELRTTA